MSFPHPTSAPAKSEHGSLSVCRQTALPTGCQGTGPAQLQSRLADWDNSTATSQEVLCSKQQAKLQFKTATDSLQDFRWHLQVFSTCRIRAGILLLPSSGNGISISQEFHSRVHHPTQQEPCCRGQKHNRHFIYIALATHCSSRERAVFSEQSGAQPAPPGLGSMKQCFWCCRPIGSP